MLRAHRGRTRDVEGDSNGDDGLAVVLEHSGCVSKGGEGDWGKSRQARSRSTKGSRCKCERCWKARPWRSVLFSREHVSRIETPVPTHPTPFTPSTDIISCQMPLLRSSIVPK